MRDRREQRVAGRKGVLLDISPAQSAEPWLW